MKLDSIVPWGRSLDEYQAMFALTQTDLEKTILGCGDGPASFNAELTARGGDVVSVDPVYQFNTGQIRSRIEEIYPSIISQMKENRDQYHWRRIKSVEQLGELRLRSMDRFLADYHQGKRAGRYIAASLPELPFTDSQFDLALCSHLLFLYSEKLTLNQHIQGLKALCRVAREVRIYPLVTLQGSQSPYLEDVVKELNCDSRQATTAPVDYCFQKGADRMLVIRQMEVDQTCEVASATQ